MAVVHYSFGIHCCFFYKIVIIINLPLVRPDSLSQVLHQLHERLQRGGRHCFPPEPPSWGGTGCHELLHGWRMGGRGEGGYSLPHSQQRTI